MKKILFVLLLAVSLNCCGQTFSNVNIDIKGLWGGTAGWCDFDNDGDYDLIINGCTGLYTFGNSYGGLTLIYENIDNNFIFLDTLNLYENGNLIINDFNNDNNPDLFETGFIPSDSSWVQTYRYSSIYLGNGELEFEFQDDLGFLGVKMSTAISGDFDNDGDIDIIYAGASGSGDVMKIYLNNNGSFEEVEIFDITGFHVCKLLRCDFDNDGDLDILMYGSSQDNLHSIRLYRNDGDLNFTLHSSIPIPTLCDAAIEIGDLDSDGYMDIVIAGATAFNPNNYNPTAVALYNRGNFNFERTDNFLNLKFSHASMSFGDCNNDGQTDLLITGVDDSIGRVTTMVYVNHNGIFAPLFELGYMVGVRAGDATWIDYNNDGNLDFFICGHIHNSMNIISHLYKNNGDGKTNIPELQIPANLNIEYGDNSITFSWDPIESPYPYTYNLYVGTAPGRTDIMSPSSDILTGFLKTPDYGNVQYSTSYTIKNLDMDINYYWGVQAVNPSFKGSQYSPEQQTHNMTGIEETFYHNNTYVFPNPVVSQSNLVMPDNNKKPYSLSIYSNSGELVKNIISTDENLTLKNKDFTSGIYFYKVIYDNNDFSTGKFIVY